MRIGCLQFAPQLGDTDHNLSRADAVLSKANPQDLDLLVLPELAFSGYNFKSLRHITPYLEPTASGITSLWARTTALKYNCVVMVGYPEKVNISPKWPTSPEYYSSTLAINGEGETIANYRKSFLYYIDESWALEGPDGFYDGEIEGLGNVALGICMDLNPYKFEAPWSAWEFAYHILHREANLAVISMAWLTREDARSYSRSPKDPDMETLAYWVARLEPLIRAEGEEEIIIVFANRCGVEDEAVFAGTSAVLGIQHGEVKLYGVLGRGERELLVVDTKKRPQAKLVHDALYVAAPTKRGPTDSGISRASNSSAGSKTSHATAVSTSSTMATNGSAYEDETDPIGSIGEVLAAAVPLSPVEPKNPHAFFHQGRTNSSDLQPLVSTIEKKQDVPPTPNGFGIKGVNGTGVTTNGHYCVELPKQSPPVPLAGATSTVAKQMVTISSQETRRTLKSATNAPPQIHATPAPETPGAEFERPSSPKSRNASRNRQAQQQEEALYNHDLAGVEPPARNSISRNRTHSRSGSISQHRGQHNVTPGMVRGGNTASSISFRPDDGPKSAGDADIKIPPGVEIVHDSTDNETGDSDDDGFVEGMYGSPRPKSVGW